jgi:hypothetical protein
MKKVLLIFIVLVAAANRIMPHPANFTPLTALALFSGAKLDKKTAIIIPVLAMLISDFFLGFHLTMPFVYVSFIIITLIGRRLKKEKAFYLLSAGILSSVLFFLITNFGFFLTSGMYPLNLTGLVNAYVMGLPFFRNTFIGDLFYTFILFYGYNYLAVFINKLRFGVAAPTTLPRR